jgi:hypothetical protein
MPVIPAHPLLHQLPFLPHAAWVPLLPFLLVIDFQALHRDPLKTPANRSQRMPTFFMALGIGFLVLWGFLAAFAPAAFRVLFAGVVWVHMSATVLAQWETQRAEHGTSSTFAFPPSRIRALFDALFVFVAFLAPQAQLVAWVLACAWWGMAVHEAATHRKPLVDARFLFGTLLFLGWQFGITVAPSPSAAVASLLVPFVAWRFLSRRKPARLGASSSVVAHAVAPLVCGAVFFAVVFLLTFPGTGVARDAFMHALWPIPWPPLAAEALSPGSALSLKGGASAFAGMSAGMWTGFLARLCAGLLAGLLAAPITLHALLLLRKARVNSADTATASATEKSAATGTSATSNSSSTPAA